MTNKPCKKEFCTTVFIVDNDESEHDYCHYPKATWTQQEIDETIKIPVNSKLAVSAALAGIRFESGSEDEICLRLHGTYNAPDGAKPLLSEFFDKHNQVTMFTLKATTPICPAFRTDTLQIDIIVPAGYEFEYLYIHGYNVEATETIRSKRLVIESCRDMQGCISTANCRIESLLGNVQIQAIANGDAVSDIRAENGCVDVKLSGFERFNGSPSSLDTTMLWEDCESEASAVSFGGKIMARKITIR